MSLYPYSLLSAGPDLIIVAGIMLMLLCGAFLPQAIANRYGSFLAFITLLTSSVFQLALRGTALAFGGMFILDKLSFLLNLFSYALGLLLIVYSYSYLKRKGINQNEYYILLLFIVLASSVIACGNNVLILYLGLELLALSLYGIIAITYHSLQALEAAMKFFVLSALASCFLLYGISLLFGVTGSFSLSFINQVHPNSTLFALAMVFIMVGSAFKLGLVPFHLWMPDVYQGSATMTTNVIATVSKVAALAFAVRFFYFGFISFSPQWGGILIVLALISIALGNFSAIVQTNLKRLLGYSAIAHMGFIVLAICGGTNFGLQSAIFYAVTYAFTSLVIFACLMLLSLLDGREYETLEDLANLGKLHPFFAFIITLTMFSFAGVPPLVGFYAKFQVLSSLISQGYLISAVIAVLLSLVGAYYYLKVVKIMYFSSAIEGTFEHKSPYGKSLTVSKTLVAVNALAILAFGVLPGLLMNFITR